MRNALLRNHHNQFFPGREFQLLFHQLFTGVCYFTFIKPGLSFVNQGVEDIQGSKPSTADRHSITKQPIRAVVFAELPPARHF